MSDHGLYPTRTRGIIVNKYSIQSFKKHVPKNQNENKNFVNTMSYKEGFICELIDVCEFLS